MPLLTERRTVSAAVAVFTVSLAAPSSETVTTRFVTRAGNAGRGRDFRPVSSALTFAPGVTTQTVSVPVNGDTTDEFDEAFSLYLFEPAGALIADRQGLATINDNDAPPSLSAGNVSPFERHANNTVGVPVTLSQPSGKLVTVAYSTADGTAYAGSDYVAASGALSFPAGASANVVNVQILGDTVNEPDETFTVNLSGPSNASVAAGQGVVTIVNDDASSVQFALMPRGFL